MREVAEPQQVPEQDPERHLRYLSIRVTKLNTRWERTTSSDKLIDKLKQRTRALLP